jgi:cytochrome c553
VPSERDPKYAADNQAVCMLANVYRGMEGVEPGEVKWIRINEAVPRYWSTGRRWGPTADSSGWKAALWPRVQWGVVPVEKDGSAHFVVPANRNIFFQALDGNFREIQRERTYVDYAPGEVRSCTGCHGQSNLTTSVDRPGTLLAMTRPPSIPQPQPCDLAANGGDGLAGHVIHYPTDIQPIFDAKCVKCHGAKDPTGGLRLTGEVTFYYNTSYEELARKELAGPLISEFTSFSKGDQGNYNGAYLPPKHLGCYKSTLIAMMTEPKHPKNAKNDHPKILSPMELMVLSRWVDSNYQFYGSYFGRQHPQWVKADPGNPAYDPADFRRRATFEEAIGFLAPPWHR